MHKRGGAFLWGAVLIILGVLFLLKNLNVVVFSLTMGDIFHWIGTAWPALFLLIPGIIFHSVFFSGRQKDAGLLVPGGIMLVLGIVFQINMLYGMWGYLWPFYILSVAVGLFELYLFGGRERGLLIPVGILGGLSLIFFMGFTVQELLSYNIRQYILPAALILLGIAVISNRPGRR